MNWIFDNIQIVIIVGSTIAWWLTQRKQGDEDTPPPTDRPGREKIDVDQMERNRRLREEIQRKRQQRQREISAPVPQIRERAEPVPPRRVQRERPEEMAEQIPPMLRELMGIPDPQPRIPVPPPVPEVNPIFERQQRIQGEMAGLDAKRREAEAMAAKIRAGLPVRRRRRRRPISSATSLNDGDFLATLRDPRQARRAVLLREILGKPIALR